MRVLVTGASGFVGRRVCSDLALRGFVVRAAVRDKTQTQTTGMPVEVVSVGPMDAHTRWQDAVLGVDAVIHLAARVHVMKETALDNRAAFQTVNVAATSSLAKAAAAAGVRRFVYVSTIKVNGDSTGSKPFSSDDPPNPVGEYAISKWNAECALSEIASVSGLETAIVRPPLVYGPGVGGNFLRLLKLISWGVPLPFGAVHNRRSMIYIGNLSNALITCAVHPSAAGRRYLVSDGDDMSTAELVQLLGSAMGKRVLLVPVPQKVLRGAGAITGRRAEIARLLDSLRIDNSRIISDLAWSAPFAAAQGIGEAARWFIAGRRGAARR